MTNRGGWTRRGAAAFSCGALIALAGCSAGHDAAPGLAPPAAAPVSNAVANTASNTASNAAASAKPSGSAGAAGAASPVTTAPLTGLGVTAAVAQRPAVAVAVAGPDPVGLGSADLVFEEMAAPVRYLAVFQSAEASTAGPVTSTRPADGQALSVLHPLTGYAGGTSSFISVLDATKIVDAGYPGHASLYSAGSGGLTVSTAALAAAGRSDGPPPGLFSYRAPDAPLASAKQTHPASVWVDIPGQPGQRWDYDARAGRWVQTAGGPRVNVANLIVQIVSFRTVYLSRKYGQTAQSARLIGTGPATVFSGTAPGGSGGTAAAGTWVKPGLAAVTNYLDAAGVPMDFAPGPTWIVLAPAGTRTTQAGGLSSMTVTAPRTRTAAPAPAAGAARPPAPAAGPAAPRRGFGSGLGRGPGRGYPVSRRKQWFASHPAWPVIALLAGYPVWWVLGLADQSVIFLAVPMLLRMRSWHRRGRPVTVPPAFGLWLLFLVCVAAGIATLGLSAPDTVVSAMSNRILSFANRGLTYAGLTVIMLYAGNLTESELPRRRLAWQLGLVGIYATIGGVGGVLVPKFQFTSPLSYVLPASVQNNSLINAAMHPAFSQVTDVLGVTLGRPKAPFEYTNTWGDCLTILLPWLLVAWWSYGSRRQRKLAIVTVAIGLIPLVYSLNRGVWTGVGLAAAYLAIRLAARGRLAMLGLVCAGLAIVGVAVVATPLQGLITSRLQHQQSNSIRASLSATAIQDANAAPLIGFGDTRHQQGSASSIAVGPTKNCTMCGQYPVGSNGQLYLLLVCNGWAGTVFFLSFFAYLGWRYRRDRTAYGMAGVLVILLSFLYMFAYVAVTAPLEFTMLAVALLWRNDQWLRHADQPAVRS